MKVHILWVNKVMYTKQWAYFVAHLNTVGPPYLQVSHLGIQTTVNWNTQKNFLKNYL
jgi:hypothetical protein